MSDQFAVVDEFEGVHQGWELTVGVEGPPRQVDDVLHLIPAAGIEVLAHCSYNYDRGGRVLVVPENPEAACAVVRGAGYECVLNPIVWVTTPYRVGVAASLGLQLQTGGVEILYAYAAWEDGQHAVFVFKTSQDDLAVRILRTALDGCASPLRVHNRAESAA